MNSSTDIPRTVSRMLIVVTIVLISGGVIDIVQSACAYHKSIEYTDKALKDTSLINKTVLAPSYTLVKDAFSSAILYFCMAVGVILIYVFYPRLQSVNIGTSGLSVILKDLPNKIDELVRQNNAIQSRSVGEGGYKQRSIDAASQQVRNNLRSLDRSKNREDDPQKGKWGGKAESNGRRITAKVIPSTVPGFFRVTIEITSTDSNKPLVGLVKFHLHDTFLNPEPVIAALNNGAILQLEKVYGPFTVGAEADDSNTKLELDLAEVQTAPDDFRNR